MPDHADFDRLNRALDDAVAALPECECARQQTALRRQCREVVLMLLHARERVRRLTEAFGPAARR